MGKIKIAELENNRTWESKTVKRSQAVAAKSPEELTSSLWEQPSGAPGLGSAPIRVDGKGHAQVTHIQQHSCCKIVPQGMT